MAVDPGLRTLLQPLHINNLYCLGILTLYFIENSLANSTYLSAYSRGVSGSNANLNNLTISARTTFLETLGVLVNPNTHDGQTNDICNHNKY